MTEIHKCIGIPALTKAYYSIKGLSQILSILINHFKTITVFFLSWISYSFIAYQLNRPWLRTPIF